MSHVDLAIQKDIQENNIFSKWVFLSFFFQKKRAWIYSNFLKNYFRLFKKRLLRLLVTQDLPFSRSVHVSNLLQVTNDVSLHAEKQKKDGTSSNDGKVSLQILTWRTQIHKLIQR